MTSKPPVSISPRRKMKAVARIQRILHWFREFLVSFAYRQEKIEKNQIVQQARLNSIEESLNDLHAKLDRALGTSPAE